MAARQGDVPTALAFYDEAEQEAGRQGVTRPMALIDRAETLLSVRLIEEARSTALNALEALTAAGLRDHMPEAQLLVAQAALVGGDHASAAHGASTARRLFLRQRRTGWAALARHVLLRAAMDTGNRARSQWQAARETAADLERHGWLGPAADARLIGVLAAVAMGRPDLAEAEASGLEPSRPGQPAEVRARAWHGVAVVRLARGDRRGAEAALRAGLRALDRHRSLLGATELRVHYAGHGRGLLAMGMGLALEDGRPLRVLQWAECGRANTLWTRPARPPSGLAADLSRLRHTVSQAEHAALEGRDPRVLIRRQATLEARIVSRARVATPTEAPAAPVALDEISGRLGDHALVELVEADGSLHAVTLARGRASLHHLGEAAPVVREMGNLRFALSRLARDHGSAQARAAARASMARSADLLDAALLRPLVAVGDRPLVLVPTGPLYALPWPVLPSCRGREVSVVASASLWAAATRAGRRRGPTVLVAGPGLDHAGREVAQVARVHRDATILSGRHAGAAAVRAAMDGAAVSHVVAHGTFRADNPQFSSLRMADGPLTVYDLEGLSRAPTLLVLSACHAALSAVRPGDELMGLTAAMMTLGATAVVGSVVEAPDAATVDLMTRFHQRVAGGMGPARALAEAQAALQPSGEEPAMATTAFVCFGAGG